MSNFLDHLTARSLNRAEAVEPRLPSLFEPPRIASEAAAALPHQYAPPEEAHDENDFEISEGALPGIRRPRETVPITPSFKNSHEPPGSAGQRFDDKAKAERDRDQPSPLVIDAAARGNVSTEKHESGTRPQVPASKADEGREPAQLRPSLLPDLRRVPAEQARDPESNRAGEAHSGDTAGRSQEREALLPLGSDIGHLRRHPTVLQSANVMSGAGSSAKSSEADSLLQASRDGLERFAPAAVARARAQEPAPTIRITIGRVEVRAVMPAQPAPRAAAAQRQPALSLDEYLKQRSGGRQ
jgi:hypothetical protein